MKKNEASITSLISVYARVYHAQNELSPIFSDSTARKLFTDEEYRNIGDYIAGKIDFFAPKLKERGASRDEIISHIVKNDLAPTPVCRDAYCEEALKTAVRTGTEQYVILGAGLDTFALRNPEFLARHKVYEVDHPLTQADKRKRLSRAGFLVYELLTPRDIEKKFIQGKVKDMHAFENINYIQAVKKAY